MNFLQLIVIFSTILQIRTQKDPKFAPVRNTIVHLFEWKWTDIAEECERFLAPKGYGGVQISPPNENLILKNRPWFERYQPVSYKIITRSGNEEEFLNMTKRCNAVEVRIYADAVINHMSAGSGRGTGGNFADHHSENYSAVPYTSQDFNPQCSIQNYQDPKNVRNCELVGLRDLNLSREHVRIEITKYLNHLIDLGVAGFRIDAAKHMWPQDFQKIYSKLKNLKTNQGFPPNSRPFIYQEVIDISGNEGVKKTDYVALGAVIEFKYSEEIGRVFNGNDKLTYLKNWGKEWGFLDGLDAVAFVDNHDNQRSGSSNILTYKKSKRYKMAIAFMLAHPYGTTRIMSSYGFDNFNQGPPADTQVKLISPEIKADGTCSNGFICEHRWRQIYNMIGFKNVVKGTGINDWWSNGDQQIAFCRGDKGFIAFTNSEDIRGRFQTCLKRGTYCDIISGSVDKNHRQCSGKSIIVEDFGWANITLKASEEDGVIAIHADSKIL